MSGNDAERDVQTSTQPEKEPVGQSQVAVRTRPRVVVIAAMEREILPLVRGWNVEVARSDFKQYRIFERGNASVICGGIGAVPAQRATEFMVARFHPEILISAGYAGDLSGRLSVGRAYMPGTVVEFCSRRKFKALFGNGILVSAPTVLGPEEKREAGATTGANAVDMEAAAVAEVSQLSGIGFLAVKAISEEWDFPMPPMDRFVGRDGDFRVAKFAAWVAIRPSQWSPIRRLKRNCQLASAGLCSALAHLLEKEDMRRESGIA